MESSGGWRLLLAMLLAVVIPASAQGLPASNLFEADWNDRSVFAPGLHPAQARQVPELAGAPVYRLDWTIETPTLLRARQEVLVTNYSGETWSELYFLLLPSQLGGRMLIERLRLDGEPVEPQLLQENTVLRIPLPGALEPGEAVVVALDYRLEIPESGGGNYGILAFQGEVLSLAHAYALLAVYDDEGWDIDLPPRYGDLVYARSSFFRVRVSAPVEFGVAASGRLVDWRLEAGRQELELVAGPVRDFYLAAGREWEQVIRVEEGIIVRGHALPGSEAKMEEAVETAARALELFGELYGHYPFRELDVVPITTSALGVEFPGIIALRLELLEDDDDHLLGSTVVHEVAHQWFYSLVGNDQVSEPWLDESVTQYLTMRYYLEVHGERSYRLFRQGLLSRWEQIDRDPLPLGGPVAAYTMREYGALIYGLGPLVVEMLSERMGQEVFDDFLRSYTSRNAFGLATPQEFMELAEQYCDCSLNEFFEKWIVPRGVGDPGSVSPSGISRP